MTKHLHDHMQGTYQFLFDEAHRALNLGGSFRPFGAGVRKNGEPIETYVDLGNAAADPQAHIGGLISGLKEEDQRHGLMAAGLVFDGQMTDAQGAHGRALVFHLEAANGRAVEVVVPYEVKLSVVDFSEPVVTEVVPEIFPPQFNEG
ncbi:MAG: hypothetical protein JNJ73_17630 [Hyphomonadaceae bacterium]|nr:hypothetical protein [Hyphomonadaceae bacterium]